MQVRSIRELLPRRLEEGSPESVTSVQNGAQPAAEALSSSDLHMRAHITLTVLTQLLKLETSKLNTPHNS